MMFFKTEGNQNKTFEKAPTRHHTRLSSRIHKNSDRSFIDREAAILNNFLILSTYLDMELT